MVPFPALMPVRKPQRPKPGSCAMRLVGVENLSSSAKTDLIGSIADDISAAFVCIGQQAKAGNLDEEHTTPVNRVLKLIRDTDFSQRQRLQIKLWRMDGKNKKFVLQRTWMRTEFGKVVNRADEVSKRWKERVEKLTRELDSTKIELSLVKTELELLKASIQKREKSEKYEDGTFHMQKVDTDNANDKRNDGVSE